MFARNYGGAMTAAVVLAVLLSYLVILSISALARAIDRINHDLAVLAYLPASAESSRSESSPSDYLAV
ncbi:hypothetical protein ACFY3U_10690 [Micromonospora sp. NPDC000089]|uniref:hypothetical protein n=1 Tax=unclassified Micromonospora TaxID=2617518 RepID=UPI0036ABDE50